MNRLACSVLRAMLKAGLIVLVLEVYVARMNAANLRDVQYDSGCSLIYRPENGPARVVEGYFVTRESGWMIMPYPCAWMP